MKTFVRSFVLAFVLALIATPSLHAERTGTNPHPQVALLTTLQIIGLTVSIYLGV
jgi:hypothetical protein